MIDNRMRAFALSTAFAIICSAPPAIAGKFDGNWSMVAETTHGHCGDIEIGLGINRGRIHFSRVVLLVNSNVSVRPVDILLGSLPK